MTPTTPLAEAPNAPSATIATTTAAAAPSVAPVSSQLVPEKGSPTAHQPDASTAGHLHDSSPLQTPNEPPAEEEDEEEVGYDVWPCAALSATGSRANPPICRRQIMIRALDRRTRGELFTNSRKGFICAISSNVRLQVNYYISRNKCETVPPGEWSHVSFLP